MQSADFESEEGVKFSCQVNTDGGTVNAIKLKIYDKDSQCLLCEYIQNLDTPVRNKDYVNVLLKPYVIEVQPNTHDVVIDMVSLTPLDNYGARINYCPYNFFNQYIYDLNYFCIKTFDDSDTFIEYNTFTTESVNNTQVRLQVSENFYSYVQISLKNDRDYIWCIETYEDVFPTPNYNKTYITTGKVTGSVDTYVWVNRNRQTPTVLEDYENSKALDMYVDMKFTKDNSNFAKTELNKGYSLDGRLETFKSEDIIEYGAEEDPYPTNGNYLFQMVQLLMLLKRTLIILMMKAIGLQMREFQELSMVEYGILEIFIK